MFSLSLTCHSVLGLLERFKGTLNKHSETAKHRAEMGLEAGNILDHLLQSFIKFKAYLHTMFNDVDINLPYFAKFHLVLNEILQANNMESFASRFNHILTNPDAYNDWMMPMDMYHRLNQSFHYFPEGDEAYFALFNKIIYPLRFLMLNFESQHPFDNNILALNTYKIMVLFAPPRLTLQRLEHVFQFLCNRMDQVFKTRGIYKALNEDFTHLPNRHSLSRWPEWQKIFEDKHHFWQAVIYFSRSAPVVEIKLAPAEILNFEKASQIDLIFTYTEARNDMEFAGLCRQYHIPSHVFSLCLEVIQQAHWPRKLESFEQVPNIFVSSKDREYFWVKLPVADKRSLILGYLTECCQSIGSHAEICILDGITYSSNGFYVLLQSTDSPNNRKSSPFLNSDPQQIDYKHFRIVGQSYVWISHAGNLCLDSIEYLKHVSEETIREILVNFATQLLDTHPQIKRVTLGAGGRSPKNIFPQVNIIERMKQGIHYGDSNQQFLIKSRLEKDMSVEQHLQLDVILTTQLGLAKPDALRSCLLYLIEQSPNIDLAIQQIKQLFQRYPQLSEHLVPDLIPRLFCEGFDFSLDVLVPLSMTELTNPYINPLRLLWNMYLQPIDLWSSYLTGVLPDTLKKLLSWRDESGNNILIYAAAIGFKPLIVALKPFIGNEVNMANYIGCTALMSAAKLGHDEVVEQLLTYPNIDVNYKNWGSEQNALILAARQGHVSVINILRTIPSVDVNLFDAHGSSALMYAITRGEAAVVSSLCQFEDIDVNVLDEEERTPLICATINGNLDIVKELLKHPQIDVEHRDEHFKSVVIYAAMFNYPEIVEALSQFPDIRLDLPDRLGKKALCYALDNEHIDVIQALSLFKNFDINARDEYYCTPLICATKKGRTEIVRALKQIANIDVNLTDEHHCTALMYASMNGHPEIVDELLEYPNIKINQVDYLEWSALMFATRDNQVECIKRLRKCSEIDPNLQNNEKNTALMIAITQHNFEAVSELLLYQNLRLDLQDRNGLNTLMHACISGNVDIVRELLKCRDIDINFKDRSNNSALFYAVSRGNINIVEVLFNEPRLSICKKEGYKIWKTACDNEDGLMKTMIQQYQHIQSSVGQNLHALFFCSEEVADANPQKKSKYKR